MEDRIFTQKDLAERWQTSEATLERWRSVGCGPTYLKIQGPVRYRAVDVLAFEEQNLRVSTAAWGRKAA